jgi:hypothetical protein
MPKHRPARFSTTRATVLLTAWLGLSAGLLLPAAFAAGPVGSDPARPDPVELGLQHAGSLGMLRVTANGVAYDGCPPDLASVSAQGSTLVVRALASTGRCLDAAQPYSLRSDLLRAAPADSGLYRVRLELQSSPESTPWLEAFSLIPARSSPTLVPESGFWWGEAGGEFGRGAPGFGVLVEVQGDTVAVSVSGYDDLGRPEWLMGSARLEGRTTRIALGRLLGGSGPHGGFRSPAAMDEAGRLHIEWLGSARALFWFEQPAADGFGIDLVPVSMVRFGFAGDSGRQWLGRWLLAAERDFDGMPAPRTIDFSTVEPTVSGFMLLGTGSERLECTLDRGRPNSPPELCRLLLDTAPIDFIDVALRQLHAADPHVPLTLIRLDR